MNCTTSSKKQKWQKSLIYFDEIELNKLPNCQGTKIKYKDLGSLKEKIPNDRIIEIRTYIRNAIYKLFGMGHTKVMIYTSLYERSHHFRFIIFTIFEFYKKAGKK